MINSNRTNYGQLELIVNYISQGMVINICNIITPAYAAPEIQLLRLRRANSMFAGYGQLWFLAL